MEIVPAILTDKKEDFTRMFNQAQGYSNMVQVDIMDGKFVPSKSISIEDLKEQRCTSYVEAHLMVENPLLWIKPFKELGAKRIIFHYEIEADKDRIIESIKDNSLSSGLAVNPKTQIDQFVSLVDKVDTILFMSVVPGFYGSEFIPSVLEKIKEFRKLYPNKAIGIDGGVKKDNIEDIVACKPDFICVGSAILKSENPSESYKEFSKFIKSNK